MLGRDNDPVHVRWEEDRIDKATKTIILVSKIVTSVYTGLVAWEMMKMLFPHLRVQEQVALERVKILINRRPPERHVPHEWVRQVMDSIRGDEDG